MLNNHYIILLFSVIYNIQLPSFDEKILLLRSTFNFVLDSFTVRNSLDPDPGSGFKVLLDPDPNSMNMYPQTLLFYVISVMYLILLNFLLCSWYFGSQYICWPLLVNIVLNF